MRKMIIVLGAESTGTRFVTECFCKAGAVGEPGSDNKEKYGGWAQRWDIDLPDCPVAVYRRTHPYQAGPNMKPDLENPASMRKFYDLQQMHDVFSFNGLEVQYVITTREFDPCVTSQLANRHVKCMEEAVYNYTRAMAEIWKFVYADDKKWVVCNYESMISFGRPYVSMVIRKCGLELIGESIHVKDGNKKYHV